MSVLECPLVGVPLEVLLCRDGGRMSETLLSYVCLGSSHLVAALAAVQTLLRRRARREWARSPREALLWMWRLHRALLLSAPVGSILSVILIGFDGSELARTSATNLAWASVWVLTSALSSTHNRRRVTALLLRLTLKDEAQGAAAVAALVGRVGMGEALRLAKREFRVVPFETLHESHFSSNRTAGAPHGGPANPARSGLL